MKFNEDSRVKIPGILHLTKLGYDYLPLKDAKWSADNNIFTDIFLKSVQKINDGLNENDAKRLLDDVPDKIKIFNGDILFSWSASLEVIQWSGGEGALNQHIFKVTSEKYPKSYYYFELLNYLQHFKMMADLRKTTMGHITQEHLKLSRIVIPPKKIINQLDGVINPILKKVNKNKIENQKLAELRDWLLPMLMNGQVKVN